MGGSKHSLGSLGPEPRAGTHPQGCITIIGAHTPRQSLKASGKWLPIKLLYLNQQMIPELHT